MPPVFARAVPIWISEDARPNAYACFYAAFTRGEGAPCAVRVAADSHYALYLNGEYIYAFQYADDARERVYDEIDLSPRAKPGENELRVEAYHAGTDSSIYKKGAPYVIFEVTCDGACAAYSGAHTLCAPHSRYTSGEMAQITPQMGYTFEYDARAKPFRPAPARLAPPVNAWAARPVAQCALGARKPARIAARGAYLEKTAHLSIGKRMRDAFLSGESLEERGLLPVLPCAEGLRLRAEKGDGAYCVLDLGEETAGLLDIEIELAREAEVLIGWGEHLDDLRVRAYVGGRTFCARLLAPAGRTRFVHPFRRLGARYLQIHVAAGSAVVHYAGLLPTEYPVPAGAGARMGSALHNRVYEVCRRTLLLCMHEHYEDCPWREQALYAMDSRNQMLAGYYVFGEYAFARASLRLLARSLRPDGLLELCAPARCGVNIPSFSLMFAVALWEYFLYSGDEAFARETLPAARAVVDTALARARANGLLPRYAGKGMWNFYEWSPALDGHLSDGPDADENRFDAPLNAFAVLAASSLAKILRALHMAEEAAPYQRASNALGAAAHNAFFNADTGMYASFLWNGRRWGADELTQALCVYAGICPENQAEAACARLTDGSMTPATLAYTIFKYEALLCRDGYGEWVARDIERQWGSMLARGATSFWETIRGGDDFDFAGSLCHGWSAVPAYLYFAYGAGVKPARPGWAGIQTRPVPGMPPVKAAAIRKPDGSVCTMEELFADNRGESV